MAFAIEGMRSVAGQEMKRKEGKKMCGEVAWRERWDAVFVLLDLGK